MPNNQKKNIAAIISAIFLFLALFNGWPYDFFTVLRIVVCISAAYIAWLASQENQENWIWIFGAIAILFNPIFIVALTRGTWKPIDLIVGIIFIVSISKLKFFNTDTLDL